MSTPAPNRLPRSSLVKLETVRVFHRALFVVLASFVLNVPTKPHMHRHFPGSKLSRGYTGQLLLILFVRNVAFGLQRGARSGFSSCHFLKSFIHFPPTGVPILVPSSSGGGMSHCHLHLSQPIARTIVLRICVLTGADCKDQHQVPFLNLPPS